jgi:translation elongation factor EF-Tu-like GTPase
VGEADPGRFEALERERGYVHARLRLERTEAGGRNTPIASGYRPQWDLGLRNDDGAIAYCDAQVRLIGVETLAPGEEADVRLHPALPEYWVSIASGAVLSLYEGNRKLGEAHVVDVVGAERPPPEQVSE